MIDSTEENINKFKITKSSAIFISIFVVVLLSPIVIYLIFLSSHNKSDDCLSKNSLSALKIAINKEFPDLQKNSVEINGPNITDRKNIELNSDTYTCEACIKKDDYETPITYNYNFKDRTVSDVSAWIPNCSNWGAQMAIMEELRPLVLNQFKNKIIFASDFKNVQKTANNSKTYIGCTANISLELKDPTTNIFNQQPININIPTSYYFDVLYGLFYPLYFKFDLHQLNESHMVSSGSETSSNSKTIQSKKDDYTEETKKSKSSNQNYREREIEKTKNELLMPSKDSVQQAESDLF